MLHGSLSYSEKGLVVVASPLSATLSDKHCDDYINKNPKEKHQSVCMGRVFNISYKIKSVVAGKFKKTKIKAIDFYHYSGLPDHMIIDPACVSFRTKMGVFIHQETVPPIKTTTGYTCDFSTK